MIKNKKKDSITKNSSLLSRWLYIKKFINSFTTMGSVTPSSKRACKILANQIKSNGGYILELGPGSGTVTKAILDSGVSYEKFIAVEIDEHFYHFMKNKFPKLNIIHASATDLQKILPKDAIGNVSTIISTIPMLNLKEDLIKEIIDASFSVMKKDGNFVQICYKHTSPINSKKFGLKQYKCATVLWNIPPMTVFEYQKENKESY